MLAFTWVALRFIHFTTLMLVFGCALYGAWLAPVSVRRLMMRRFFASATACRSVELHQRDADAGDPGGVNGLRLAGCCLY